MPEKIISICKTIGPVSCFAYSSYEFFFLFLFLANTILKYFVSYGETDNISFRPWLLTEWYSLILSAPIRKRIAILASWCCYVIGIFIAQDTKIMPRKPRLSVRTNVSLSVRKFLLKEPSHFHWRMLYFLFQLNRKYSCT